ncbi:MAG: TM0106 family RecB-like putative nuclease [Mycobacterium sp.]
MGDEGDARVVYSASDLAAAARCEYALLRAFDAKLGRGPRIDVEDELLARTSTLGDEHERRQLDDLRAEFDGDVTVIGRPKYTAAGLRAAFDQTMRAVESRSSVIYQAAMFDGRFAGFADFLVLEGDRYRLRDTKLARSVKVEALLQLAAYADTLARSGVPVVDEVELVLGDGAVAAYRVDELLPVYLPRRAALERLLDGHVASGAPVAWGDEGVRACFRCAECAVQVRATDDLLLVAGMRVSQRARLLDAGVTSVHELAAHTDAVPELSTRAVTKLAAQARLQIAERVDGKPPYEVVDAQPLMTLPDANKGDVFFDFEGDPLWTVDGREWGLEYLWGVLTVTDEFTPYWAHDRASERQALIDFLAMVRKRLKRHPGMHVYHYAAYEKSTLLRLAGRYGVGENVVDDLLRNGILVDLYPLLRKSIRVGTESYSIKYLEPLYMGNELRSGEVTTATDSITQYARYSALRNAGNLHEADVVLKEIEDYNRYDCRSTRRLRDWLMARAIESEVPPRGPQAVRDAEAQAPVEIADDLERTLMRFAGDGIGSAPHVRGIGSAPHVRGIDQRTPEQTAVAMISAARGFHQREDKPFWWSHFDRINNPVDEWADESGVFIAEHAEVITAWEKPPRARKLQRQVLLTGELAAGELGRDLYALYAPPGPAGLKGDPDRRVWGSAEPIECDDPSAPTQVLIREREPKEGGPFEELPFALTPGPPINNGPLRESIAATAAHLGATLPDLPADAVTDILLRRPPRSVSGGALPRTGEVIDDIACALLDLDSSYLAVHGPPGTGKTYTAARVIARLIGDHGWRVGIVAQSHAVVENLLGCVIDAGVDHDRVGKKKSAGARWRDVDEKDYAAFIADHHGCVIGGTAWDFANDGRVPRGSLDLLVLEEAGQYSLANTIAVASAARNLLLLGDPQQLPQVTQGTHPEPVDHSALGWLVSDGSAGHHTLPPERGYFLELSHRMHPAVCGPVSRLSYDGRLRSHARVSSARRLDGVTPGVRALEIDHDGNSTDSPEEADAIVDEIQHLLGTPWTDEDGTVPLGQDHVLVVTPYNAQVVMLRQRLDAAGLPDVEVGTVDKFQGRQAPVVFVSMTASSADDVPRGISFLLNRNRLNVAVSRAKYAAIIVRSTLLTDYLPSTPDGLIDLGAFLSLTSCDTPSE